MTTQCTRVVRQAPQDHGGSDGNKNSTGVCHRSDSGVGFGVAAAITKLPAKISVVNGGNPYVDVQVSYSCENTQTRTYYLEASLDGANGAHRVLGFRNDTGGLVTADCNHHGAKSEILRFLVGSYSPVVPLVKGEATLLVTLDPRGGPATPGGWYISTGTPVTASKTLPVK